MNTQLKQLQEKKGWNAVKKLSRILFKYRLPDEDVTFLSQEYNQINIGGVPLRNTFLLNADQFLEAVTEAKKNYVNFVFIQQDGELSLMLHLSDLQFEKEEGDVLYYFQENSGIYELVQELSLEVYDEKKEEFCTYLGSEIASETGTGTHNTEIISHETKDVLFFWMYHLLEHPNDVYNHIELKMIQFQPILSSVYNAHYTAYQHKIAFAVRLDYGVSIDTDYFDIGYGHP